MATYLQKKHIITKTATATKMQRSTSVTHNIEVNRKLVVIGDGGTGKTSMLFTFSRDTYPEVHIPTILEAEIVQVTPASRPGQSPPPVELTVWDTAGQEDYDGLRPLVYNKTDVFVVCYSVDNYSSYINVWEKWLPDLRHLCPRTPIVLVATKTDLRFDGRTHRQLAKKGLGLITTTQGQTLGQKVQARAYLECSCEDKDSIFKVFQTAATVALYCSYIVKKPRPGSCTLL